MVPFRGWPQPHSEWRVGWLVGHTDALRRFPFPVLPHCRELIHSAPIGPLGASAVDPGIKGLLLGLRLQLELRALPHVSLLCFWRKPARQRSTSKAILNEKVGFTFNPATPVWRWLPVLKFFILELGLHC